MQANTPEVLKEGNTKEYIAGPLPEHRTLPEMQANTPKVPNEGNMKEYIAGSLPEMQANTPEVLEEGKTKECPICQSPVRLFSINMEDRLLMCENQDCEYPFGYMEMRIIGPGEEAFNDETTQSRDKSGDNNASVSENEWAEIDKLSFILNSMSVQLTEPCTNQHKKQKITPTETSAKEEEQLFRNIEDIEALHQLLSSLNNELSEQNQKEEEGQIKNEKWIKNLKSLQEMSGVQLLKPDEMGLLKKEPVIGSGELKIDIGPGNVPNDPSIRIEIHNDSEKEKVGAGKTPIMPDKPEAKDPLSV